MRFYRTATTPARSATSVAGGPASVVEAVRENGKVSEGLIFRLVGVSALAVAMALGMAACGKRDEGFRGPMALPVETATAVKQDTRLVINAFGNTEALADVDLIVQVTGQLLTNFVSDGALVTNGQPLALIDPRDYVATVHKAQAAVEIDQANLELKQLMLERNKPLAEKNLISKLDFDSYRIGVNTAEAQLHASRAALELAQIDLSRCTVTATVNGVCAKILKADGNLVVAGQTRLTNIRSYDPLDLEFSISEQYVPLIRQALAAGPVPLEVKPRGDTNSYPGQLVFIDNAVNLKTGTILLRGKIPNANLKLWANQFVEVILYAGTIKDAVLVPESTVQFGKDGPYLFAVTPDGKADLKLVTPGVRHDGLLEIRQGLQAGETVVVYGQLMLQPGMPVINVAKPPAGAPAGPADAGAHGQK